MSGLLKSEEGMGNRSKLLVQHTGIKLPKDFVDKHKKDYYIPRLDNGDYVLNISSKKETKSHFDILMDIEDLVENEKFNIYGVVLWDDGRIDKYNFSTGEEDFNITKN